MSELTPAQEEKLTNYPSAYYATPPLVGGGQDFRAGKITDHVGMLSWLNDAAAHATAEMWGNAAALYETALANMDGYRNALTQAWRSEASVPFFGHIGGTLYSLRLWVAAARSNERHLHRVGSAIQKAQTDMAALYAHFKTAVERIDKDESGIADVRIGDSGDEGKVAMTEEVNGATAKSRAIMETLAKVFMETPVEVEPMFAGPSGARQATEAEMRRAFGAQAPGGAPQAPGGGGAQPAAPGAPPVAPVAPAGLRPQAPVAPPQAPPVAPAIPGAPPTAPGSGRGPAPVAPVIPRSGQSAGGRGAPPGAPTIGSVTGLGTGLAGARGAQHASLNQPPGGPPSGRGMPPPPPPPGAPSMPRNLNRGLQGRTSSTPPPAAPPGGTRQSNGTSPSLRGRSALRPGSLDAGRTPGDSGSRGLGPGGPPGVPRSLQGSRAVPEGVTRRKPNGKGPVRPGAPGSSATAALRGRGGLTRAGHAENARTTRAALRRGLDGRGLVAIKHGRALGSKPTPIDQPVTPLPPTDRPEGLAAEVRQMLGDEGLFNVGPPAPAVIESPPEKVHAKRPGPALGLAGGR